MISRTAVFLSIVALLSSLGNSGCRYSVEPKDEDPVQPSITFFEKVQGYEHRYDLYFPSSFTGWIPSSENQLQFDESTSTYFIHNINIAKDPIDDFGPRFKITSRYWENQFGFTPNGSSIEQSSFGIKPKGTIVRIERISDTNDLFFEVPSHSDAEYLHVSIKFLAKTSGRTAFLHAHYTDNRL